MWLRLSLRLPPYVHEQRTRVQYPGYLALGRRILILLSLSIDAIGQELSGGPEGDDYNDASLIYPGHSPSGVAGPVRSADVLSTPGLLRAPPPPSL